MLLDDPKDRSMYYQKTYINLQYVNTLFEKLNLVDYTFVKNKKKYFLFTFELTK